MGRNGPNKSRPRLARQAILYTFMSGIWWRTSSIQPGLPGPVLGARMKLRDKGKIYRFSTGILDGITVSQQGDVTDCRVASQSAYAPLQMLTTHP